MTRVGRRPSPHMGALPAKFKKKSPHNWSWSGPPGEHSPYPTDPAPYPGYQISYCFLDIMASYKTLDNTLNLGPLAVSTDVDDYMNDLETCYKEGYHLNAYVRVPGLKTTIAVEDWGVKTPYQAILSKPLKTAENKELEWDLHIEKCILSTRMRAFEAQEGENDLLRTIQKHAESGGRLRCAVPVGYVRSTTSNDQYGVIGMELFFNMPKNKTETRYTYHAIKIPARYYTALDATQTIQQVSCDSDFLGQMKLFLNQGWKLVDICIDTMALSEAFRMRTSMKIVDTLWIFEKDKAKLHDTTPRYEGVIIEYLHKVKSQSEGDFPTKDWRPVIAGMGVMGWQLTAMIQSPVIVQSGFTTYTMKMLMIFQRKLVDSFEQLRDMKATKVADGYPGSSSNKRSQHKKGNVYFARGLDEDNTGYYHETLKKYIYSNDSSIGGPIRLNTFSTLDEDPSPRMGNGIVPQQEPRRQNSVNGFIPQGSGYRRNDSANRRGVYPPTYTEAMRLNVVPIT